MRRSIIHFILAVFGLGLHGLAAGGGGGGIPRLSPVVLSAMVDFKEKEMVISGQHFGDVTPTVKLANQILKVKNASADQIVVYLPSGIQSTTYSLVVTRNGAYQQTSSAFHVAVFFDSSNPRGK